jgi:TPR repeat protein
MTTITDHRVAQPTAGRLYSLRPDQAIGLPLSFAVALAALAFLPSVRQTATLWWSLLGAAAVLIAWAIALYATARRHGRTFTIEVVLRRQHYVQACAHLSIFLYWGWYWRPVYDSAALIAAQLAFAYAFDLLLSWSRRDHYVLGFGPFPIIFSTNLFLWFKPAWFYWQFVMVGIGFAAKELIRWNKDGKRTHIFNPSSFPLSVASIVLIATGSTTITWGPEIAVTQLLPPQIYLFLFLIALPGQFFFGVTSMTMSAVVTMYAFGLAYFAATGTYFFFASYIPIAVFLGMHLLFTDPSTAPRTELGRIIFGVAYALSVIVLYGVLESAGIHSFYDKLLPVPLLNLSIKGIDRLAQSNALQWLNPARLGRALAPRQRHLAYMSIWALVFVAMSAVQGVGDTHRGQWIPFWKEACEQGLRNGCKNLAMLLVNSCNVGSGWACNEFGVLRARQEIEGVNERSGYPSHVEAFDRACAIGFAAGCENRRVGAGDAAALRTAAPNPDEYPILMLAGKGPVVVRTSLELYERACQQGWMGACEHAARYYARGEGTPRDPARAVFEFDKACTGGEPTACSSVGAMYMNGFGVARDDAQAMAYFAKACTLGLDDACQWLANNGRQ